MKYMKKLLSPCISVCYISNTSGFCEGCFRTREEISRWRYMSFEEQKRVIKKLHDRGQTNSGRSIRRPRSIKKGSKIN